MARKSSNVKKIDVVKKVEVAATKPATKTTAVRYSAIPKAAPAAKAIAITSEMIAAKAYEIYAMGQGGSEMDHWFAAERTLRAA